MHNLSVVIPVYNEDHASIREIVQMLKDGGAEVIVVDDGSVDPYPDAIKHGTNYGYGAALLTGIKNSTRDLILTMDGDNQHRIDDVCNLYNVWNMLDVSMVIGVRRLKGEKFHRYAGRKFLNMIASIMALYWLPDLNSGLRIFKKSVVMGYFPILCKKFSFTTSLTMSLMTDGHKVEWFPIQVKERTHGKSKVKVLKDGLVTLYYILKIGFAMRTRGIRATLRKLRGK